ncbi:MAG: DUF2220 family protein [Mariprofundaceae bacterium]|nr:DUF2220 family protein [Mariprofundaceae bacterium]
MTWCTPADIKVKIERCWQRGDVCRAALGKNDIFPWAMSLPKPSAKRMLDDFSGMQHWVKSMQSFAQTKQISLQWQTINHRVLGAQQLPAVIYLESAEQAAHLLGKTNNLKEWLVLYQCTIKQLPALEPWLLQHPLKTLALADIWQQLLNLCAWMKRHPNPRIYVRQVNVVGVDSKFIEQHKRVLAELFDLILPGYAIDNDYSGVAGFSKRYGFLDKCGMVRIRPLGAGIVLLHSDGDQDVSITAKAFANLDYTVLKKIKQVVIVENEINYLAFPNMDETLLVFGSGYGFEALKGAQWLHQCALYYWGDLDTHGFAILNQLRASFPHTQSFLMDQSTLMAHQHAWGIEPKQETKTLHHLHQDEKNMYEGLANNRWAEKLRLEQERIAYGDVIRAVKNIIRS